MVGVTAVNQDCQVFSFSPPPPLPPFFFFYYYYYYYLNLSQRGMYSVPRVTVWKFPRKDGATWAERGYDPGEGT